LLLSSRDSLRLRSGPALLRCAPFRMTRSLWVGHSAIICPTGCVIQKPELHPMPDLPKRDDPDLWTRHRAAAPRRQVMGRGRVSGDVKRCLTPQGVSGILGLDSATKINGTRRETVNPPRTRRSYRLELDFRRYCRRTFYQLDPATGYWLRF